MTLCREATSVDLDAVVTFLVQHLGGGKSASQYRHLFAYDWRAERPNIGYLVEDEEGIVGFIGTIYSERLINGTSEKICNITCWAMKATARGKDSLKLMQRVLAQPGYTFTGISANEEMQRILRFFRFKELDGGKYFVPLMAGLGRTAKSGRAVVHTNPEAIAARVDGETRRLLDDHVAYGCACLLLESEIGDAFVIAVRRRPGRLAFAEVLHASAPEIMMDHLPKLTITLFHMLRTMVVGLEKRWVPRPPLLSRQGGRATFFHSKTLDPGSIDFLYSEMVPLYGAAAREL
jgi:acetoacetyl-CoA synthetase